MEHRRVQCTRKERSGFEGGMMQRRRRWWRRSALERQPSMMSVEPWKHVLRGSDNCWH
jgi:hypothetical protein